MTNLQFYHFSHTEIVLFIFQLIYKQRIDMNNIVWKSNIELSKQDQTRLNSVFQGRKIVLSSQFVFCSLQCCELYE